MDNEEYHARVQEFIRRPRGKYAKSQSFNRYAEHWEYINMKVLFDKRQTVECLIVASLGIAWVFHTGPFRQEECGVTVSLRDAG